MLPQVAAAGLRGVAPAPPCPPPAPAASASAAAACSLPLRGGATSSRGVQAARRPGTLPPLRALSLSHAAEEEGERHGQGRRRQQQQTAAAAAGDRQQQQEATEGRQPQQQQQQRGWEAEARRQQRGPSTEPAEEEEEQTTCQLPAPEGGAPIHLFGVIHGGNEPEVAEFIMRERPGVVVVETSLNSAHGSAHGNTIGRQDCLTYCHAAAPGSHEQRARHFAQYGVQLADMAHPLGSHLWHDLSQGYRALYNEQLVYVAAFAVNADLVFGDRPKQITYSRMLWLPSIVDLDQAYAAMSASNYADLAHQRPRDDRRRELASANPTEAALLGERDAVMLSALHQASLRSGPHGSVVGVVGASHLAGMQRLWASGEWRQMMAGGLLHAPEGPVVPETPEDTGVRRALLDGVIRLSCRIDVQQDARKVLGPVPHASQHAYALSHELYGSTRMLLAVLDREQLAEVCSGWRCDMYDVLQPLRAVRPVNGGLGFDQELVLDLRTLNFEVPEVDPARQQANRAARL